MQWSLAGAIFRAVISLLSNIAIVRIIELEKISTYYSAVAAFGIILGVLEFGIPQILVYTNEKECSDLSASSLGYGLLMFLAFQMIGLVILVSGSMFVSSSENHMLLALALSAAAFSIPANALRAILEKNLMVKVLAKIDFAGLLVLIIFIPTTFFLPDQMSHSSYLLLATIVIGPQLLIIILLSKNVLKNGQKIIFSTDVLKKILKQGRYFSANHLVFSGYQQVDLFIAQKFLSTQEAGFYAVARVLVLQMGNVIYTGVAKFTNSKIALQQQTSGISIKQKSKYLKIYAGISLAFFMSAVVFGNYYIEIAYGKEWIPSISTMQILLVGMAMRVLSVPSAAQIVALSGVKTILFSNAVGVMLTMILGITGVYFAGREGLAIAVSTVIATITAAYIVKAR